MWPWQRDASRSVCVATVRELRRVATDSAQFGICASAKLHRSAQREDTTGVIDWQPDEHVHP